MTLYRWTQVNSGGAYAMPALHILVEAPSAREATDFAIETWGIRFNADDCECCGSRWPDYSVGDEAEGYEPTELETRMLGEVIKGLQPAYHNTTWKGEPLPLYVSGSTTLGR